jgi:hypothetical protein
MTITPKSLEAAFSRGGEIRTCVMITEAYYSYPELQCATVTVGSGASSSGSGSGSGSGGGGGKKAGGTPKWAIGLIVAAVLLAAAAVVAVVAVKRAASKGPARSQGPGGAGGYDTEYAALDN